MNLVRFGAVSHLRHVLDKDPDLIYTKGTLLIDEVMA